MPITKKQWLEQSVMSDEWGRPPSLADVPLTYMSREKAFEKRGYSKREITEMYELHMDMLETGG